MVNSLASTLGTTRPITGPDIALEVLQCLGYRYALKEAFIITYTLHDYEFTGHGLLSTLLRRQVTLGADITLLTTPPPGKGTKAGFRRKFDLLTALERNGINVFVNDNLRELLDVVESCRSDRVGLSEFVILHGEVGTGKSHALLYLQHHIADAHKDEFISPAVYLESAKLAAKMDFTVLYRRTLEHMHDHIVITAEQLDRAIEATVREHLSPSAHIEEIEREIDLLYENREITPAFPPLARLLKGVKEGNPKAMSILVGNKERELTTFGLTSPIATEYDCVKCLSAYVNLCTHPNRDYLPEANFQASKAFYLFIDEVEFVQDMKPPEVLSINQGIRDLVTSLRENLCLILSVSGDPRLLFAIFDKFVVRRWSRDPIELQLMDNDQSVSFLKEVLRNYRTDLSDPDEYPFREAALAAIAEATTSKTAANLFRNCWRVLRKAVLNGRLQPEGWIEIDDVQEFL